MYTVRENEPFLAKIDLNRTDPAMLFSICSDDSTLGRLRSHTVLSIGRRLRPLRVSQHSPRQIGILSNTSILHIVRGGIFAGLLEYFGRMVRFLNRLFFIVKMHD